jgi:hypothetical protein
MGDLLRCSPVTVVVGYSISSEQLYSMVGSFPKRSLAREENRRTMILLKAPPNKALQLTARYMLLK